MVSHCISNAGATSCKTEMKPVKKAIIIGAGIGGIATSIRLAAKGYHVEVFEKNAFPGGKLHVIEKDGFTFDAGPSLFTEPENIVELFGLAGEKWEDHFSFTSLDLSFNYYYENGKVIRAFTNIDALANEVHEQTSENKIAIKKYLNNAAKAYAGLGDVFLNYPLHKWRTWFHPRILKAIKGLRLGYLIGSLHEYNRKSFKSPELIQLFNRFATYNGSNPYVAPGMLSMIPHLELGQGTFFPKGGMISITNALKNLADRLGVVFHFNQEVDAIVSKEGKIKGISIKETIHESDVVVSNMDVYYTYSKLLRDAKKSDKVLKNERSSSACIFYWGIKKGFDHMHLHNIFFAQDYEQEFQDLFKHKQLHADPTVYVNITSKFESGLSPEGHENWFVMVNAPANDQLDWNAAQPMIRQAIIEKMNRMLKTDLEKLIITEHVMTPMDIQKTTSSYLGSLYGSSSNSTWSAFLRHANDNSDIKGLYFTGGSVHPGGGIPLCLKSAKIVSNMISP